jgi:hypothetical protein
MVMLMRQNITELSSFLFFQAAGAKVLFWLFSEGGRVHQISQSPPTPSPPIEIAQFRGFSRFCFLQRPLCKVESELCTEKSILIAARHGYAQAIVDKSASEAVDNWLGWEILGRKKGKRLRVHFLGSTANSQSQSPCQSDSFIKSFIFKTSTHLTITNASPMPLIWRSRPYQTTPVG